MQDTLALNAVIIGPRHRKDLGDVHELADSIARVGLLQPIVISPDKALIAGQRRLEAAKLLGWSEIPCFIAQGLDALDMLIAERDENTCRKDFSWSEAVAFAQELEKLEKPKAKERQGRPGESRSGNLPEHKKAETREKVAAAVGKKARTLEKAAAVVASGQTDLIAKMDETGYVDGAYKEHQRRQKRAKVTTSDPEQPTGKYRVLCADPPWAYSNANTPGQAHAVTEFYPTMSIKELCAIPVAELAEEDAVLFLWATSPMLEVAFQVINAWGFTYKTGMVWDKDAHNFGHYVSVRHEHLLICTRGSCTPDDPHLIPSVQTIKRGKHSEKPEEFRKIIETMYTHGRKLELFGRTKHDGWTVFGNQLG